MVKKTEAWEASDGTVHPTEFKAAHHEAEVILSSIGPLNMGNIATIIENRNKVWEAISPLINLDKPQAVVGGKNG